MVAYASHFRKDRMCFKFTGENFVKNVDLLNSNFDLSHLNGAGPLSDFCCQSYQSVNATH